jgi:hypothetical protein
VAGRNTSERSEDACGVVGRAATTGRVDGEIQEELKHPSDCWYVPVCWVWGDSKEDIEESCRSPEGSPEGSDFAAEEGYEEGGPNAEEGYEEVWDEVQEALSTMVHEDYDETVFAQGRKRRDPLHRHHPKRQCGLRMCLVYLYLLMSMCTTPSIR